MISDYRLQHGSAHLIGERQKAEFRKTQVEAGFKERVKGDDDELRRVVEAVCETYGYKDAKGYFFILLRAHCFLMCCGYEPCRL
ncbi:hypothetical protein AGMMS49974_06160 [Deltaproteobacteria bacterium]|nr:hypothetical protein AGMMS49974_06160 [Deltaproteobacteria bacterium]GHU98631.1 hypothetical protein AGMMS50248_05500 [Deltaproteobacteria bacterium]